MLSTDDAVGPIAPTRIGAAGATLNGVTTVGAVMGNGLTSREAEVLALIARHLTNAQIADALVISQRTVESHVSAMLRKLQLPDRRDALVRLAITFAQLGCPYQQARTGRIAAGPLARRRRSR